MLLHVKVSDIFSLGSLAAADLQCGAYKRDSESARRRPHILTGQAGCEAKPWPAAAR